jgi:hypothetical protein
MVHAPGLVRYCRHALGTEDGFRILRAAYPTIKDSTIQRLLDGDYSVVEDVVAVEEEEDDEAS